MTIKKTKKPAENFEVPLFKPKKPGDKGTPRPRPADLEKPGVAETTRKGFDDPIIGKDQ